MQPKTLQLAYLLSIDDYIIQRRGTVLEYAIETELFRRCQSAKEFFKSDNKLEWWTGINSDSVCEETQSEFDVAEIPELGANLESRF